MADLFRIIEWLNSLLWNKIGLSLIIVAGIWISIKIGFFQVRYLPFWLKNTVGSLRRGRKKSGNGAAFSQFSALCTVLAATIGVGNIAGVAAAIDLGGPGAIFWMWVAAFFSSALAFAENTLGVFYRVKNEEGEWAGGAMFYISRVLGRPAAAAFAFFCIFASFGIGNSVQVNTIAHNLRAVLPIKALTETAVFGTDLYMVAVGLIVASAVGAVLLGGAKRIGALTERLVPFMVIGYLCGTGAIIAINIKSLPEAFLSVVRHAFSLKSAAGGAVGFSLSRAAVWGLRRGVFSNEAGLGAAVSVNAAADVKEPAVQGMWGIFQVFTDTVLICSLTAFSLLCSGFIDLESGEILSSAPVTALVGNVFSSLFGRAGGIFIAAAILCFAFSTVVGWSFYGQRAWEYLCGGGVRIYLIIYVIFAFLGAVMRVDFLFALCDLFNALMLLPNVSSLILLSPSVGRITENYRLREIKGRDIPPLL